MVNNTGVLRLVVGPAVVVLLGGCAGGAPAAAPTVPVTASQSVTSSSAPPSTTPPLESSDTGAAGVPALAREHSRQGAESYAEFFLSQLNRYFMNPESESIHGLFKSSCKTCAAFVRVGDELVAQGRHNNGESVAIRGSKTLDFETTNAQVLVDIAQNPVSVVDRQGDIVETGQAARAGFIFHLVWLQSSWTVAEIKSEAHS